METQVEGKKGSDLTREELAMLGSPPEPSELPTGDDDEGDTPAPTREGAPDWAIVPADLKMPEGRVVAYVMFRASWTETAAKGDRQCILWNLSEADEKLALRRARGDAMRAIDELTKQMIRAVDGHKVDQVGSGPGSLARFWDEIGARCRQQLKGYYAKTHALGTEDSMDFFSNCIAVRTAP